jgi:hypothetical protein
MSTVREGQRVAFCGDPVDGLQPGDLGKVLSLSGDACHVLWSTGTCTGQTLLVDGMDVVASSAAPKSYDGLGEGSLVTIAVRDVYDGLGKVALLNALNEEGHLSGFAAIAETAMQTVAAEIRSDPSFKEVLAHLDSDEGAELVSLAASALLRDAFGGDE